MMLSKYDYDVVIKFFVGRPNRQNGNKNLCFSCSMSINDMDITSYGSIWGENQVLHLGSHFEVYSRKNRYQKRWNLYNTISKNIPIYSGIEVQTQKKPASSVSGNFGEVLSIMALEHMVAPRQLQVCHLTSKIKGRNASKCPDLLVESRPFKKPYKKFKKKNPNAPELPAFLPGECKNNYSIRALRQLTSYWLEIGPQADTYGFGFISCINYADPSNSIEIYLLIPKNKAKLQKLLSNNANITHEDFKGCFYGFE